MEKPYWLTPRSIYWKTHLSWNQIDLELWEACQLLQLQVLLSIQPLTGASVSQPCICFFSKNRGIIKRELFCDSKFILHSFVSNVKQSQHKHEAQPDMELQNQWPDFCWHLSRFLLWQMGVYWNPSNVNTLPKPPS